MKVFGFDTSDPAGLKAALKEAAPIFAEFEMRAAGILDTLLTRAGKAKITLTIEIPKAGADWEKTKP